VSTLTADHVRAARAAVVPTRLGRVSGLLGLRVTVAGVPAAMGDLLEVRGAAGPVPVEVVASEHGVLTCLPLADTTGLRVGDHVEGSGLGLRIAVGDELRGRVLDGLGRPIDGGPSLAHLPQVVVDNETPHALLRPRIDQQLSLGVRAMDGLTACGRGQRLGIMAGSGVGKSSLLSMIARGTEAEISVIALIGERGREVREFLENDLGAEGLARSIVVVATSDEPPVVRMRAAFVATRIAEWFRDAGRHVVLMMDSLTRVALAQRERPVRGRAPGHSRLPTQRVRDAPQAPRARGYVAVRQHHRPLHRAGRGRRPAGPDRRLRPVDPGRAHRADP
jgi:flagellum-specific ATP synthase